MKKPLRAVPQPHGSMPAGFGYAEAVAMQALYNGTADAPQQKIAMKWILEGACALPQWPYKESQRETDVALGRHWVGHQIMALVKVNLSQLKNREERNG